MLKTYSFKLTNLNTTNTIQEHFLLHNYIDIFLNLRGNQIINVSYLVSDIGCLFTGILISLVVDELGCNKKNQNYIGIKHMESKLN